MKKAIGVAVLLTAITAFGQLPQQYENWFNSPVKFLMTADELRQFRALKSADEADKFIALFWAKRDPTPATARNEFQEEFDRRVALADKEFSDAFGRGALSDRGKTLILLGPPYRVTSSAGAEVGGGIAVSGRRGAAGPTSRGPVADPDTQYWMYGNQNKPKFISQGDFTLVFARAQQGEWLLANTDRTDPNLLFKQAVNGYLVSPNLTTVPNYAKPAIYNTTFKSADIKAAFENFKADTAPLTWGEFVTGEGEHFISAHLSLPSSAAGQKVTAWAVVRDSSGKIVDVKEYEKTVESSAAETFIDESLQLDAGTYTVTFGASSLAASRANITVQGLDPKAAAVSPLILASAVIPMKTNWEPMDPFIFGGFKVVPKPDATFGTAGDLWYFVELRNPGVTDEGKPNIRVQVDVRGTTAKGPVEMHLPMQDAPIAPLKDETNRYALGTTLPLESFRPGDYTMKVHIVDVALGKEYDLEKAFHIHG